MTGHLAHALNGQRSSKRANPNDLKNGACAIMEVPCCHGMMRIVEQAMDRAGKDFPVETVVVTVLGERE